MARPMTPAPRRIALQLWTLREHLRTPAEVARTFERVRQIGYEHVELAGLCSMPAREIKQLADDSGLNICSAHLDPREIIQETSKVADTLSELGCRCVAYPHLHVPLETLDQVSALADDLTRAGEALRRRGRLLTYHHHATEFRRLDGKAILDWLFDRTDPLLVHAELDTYWVQYGGGDPARYCARLSGRLPLLHLKDYAIDGAGRPVTAALGEGNLNFTTILREAESAACDWYVVEQDCPPEAAFQAIATSLAFLRQ